jgi:hypothetical protein
MRWCFSRGPDEARRLKAVRLERLSSSDSLVSDNAAYNGTAATSGFTLTQSTRGSAFAGSHTVSSFPYESSREAQITTQARETFTPPFTPLLFPLESPTMAFPSEPLSLFSVKAPQQSNFDYWRQDGIVDRDLQSLGSFPGLEVIGSTTMSRGHSLDYQTTALGRSHQLLHPQPTWPSLIFGENPSMV